MVVARAFQARDRVGGPERAALRSTLRGTVMRNFVALLAVASLATLVHAADTSPVADAAMAKDAATVKALIAKGADINTPQGDGMSALHWAAKNGDAPLAQMLLYAGANVRATTRL